MIKHIIMGFLCFAVSSHLPAMEDVYTNEDRLFDAVCEDNQQLLAELFDNNLATINQRSPEPLINDIYYDNQMNMLVQETFHANTTPLMQAAFFHDNADTIKFFLKRGARIDDVDHQGFTPLLIALKEGNAKAALALIIAGADVHKRAKCGCGCLDYAVQCDSIDCLHALVKSGVDLDSKNGHAMTPLLIATIQNNLAAMRSLILYGASVNSGNNEKVNSLDHAVYKGYRDGVFLLLRHNAKRNTETYKTSCPVIGAMFEDYSGYCILHPEKVNEERKHELNFIKLVRGIERPHHYITHPELYGVSSVKRFKKNNAD